MGAVFADIAEVTDIRSSDISEMTQIVNNSDLQTSKQSRTEETGWMVRPLGKSKERSTWTLR